MPHLFLFKMHLARFKRLNATTGSDRMIHLTACSAFWRAMCGRQLAPFWLICLTNLAYNFFNFLIQFDYTLSVLHCIVHVNNFLLLENCFNLNVRWQEHRKRTSRERFSDREVYVRTGEVSFSKRKQLPFEKFPGWNLPKSGWELEICDSKKAERIRFYSLQGAVVWAIH